MTRTRTRPRPQSGSRSGPRTPADTRSGPRAPAPGPPPYRKSTAREYFESIVIAVILALFVRTWIVEAFTIPTGSMEHNLLVGDYLLVNKFVFSPSVSGAERFLLPQGTVSRGDIIVFKFPRDPGRDFIKRVIGLPGETLEVREGEVHVDGAPLDEPWLRQPGTASAAGAAVIPRRDNHGPVAIPAGHYFMMGDNRGNSEDSRVWGVLPHEHIKGRAVVLYWSYDSGSPVVIPEPGIGPALRRIGSMATHFFTRTRWDRMLRQVR